MPKESIAPPLSQHATANVTPQAQFEALNLGNLPNRKRAAGSDVQITDPNFRSSSPAKLFKTSSGDLRAPQRSPETHIKQLGHKRNNKSDCARVRLAEQSSLNHVSSQSSLPPNSLETGAESTAVHNDFGSSLPTSPIKSEEPEGLVNLKQYPKRPPSHSSQSHSITSQSRGPQTLVTHSRAGSKAYVGQPESRQISQRQLAEEVRGIYSTLVMIEQKCINIINHQTAAIRERKGKEQRLDHWQALIALHRSLLHEHHDFFLASQHPTASPPIRDLALRYSMPARMWKHGIHNFLELLRCRLPESLDYMLAFIYLAYQMMALLYETVPSFQETWIECLGDLARYRMAIEDEDPKDRETWTNVARFWYCKAVDKNPSTGRLYHHLAILARHSTLQQLSSYCRSLTANVPFLSSRDSIMTLFEPIVARAQTSNAATFSNETICVAVHATIFTRGSDERYNGFGTSFLNGLNSHISKIGSRWREQGAYVAAANIGCLLKYGVSPSTLRDLLESSSSLDSKTTLQVEKKGTWSCESS